MDQSAVLGLPYIMPSQAQKHVTHNEALRALDAIVQVGAASATQTSPPAVPADGARYVVPAGGLADWAGQDHAIAVFEASAWTFYAPQTGWLIWVEDEMALRVWDGAAWADASGATMAAQFGINTNADTINRLSVKSDAVLFSHDDVTPGSGDARVSVNKAAAGDSASVVFQTGFAGRAEFGTTGDDDWHVKVSPDGTVWHEALVAARNTGFVGHGTAAPIAPLHVAGNDTGLVIENTNAVGSYWGFAAGRTGANADELVLSSGPDLTDALAQQVRFAKDAPVQFLHGAVVQDTEGFGSAEDTTRAVYKPFDGTKARMSFRGAEGTGVGELRLNGYYHDGSWNNVVVGSFRVSAAGVRLGVGTTTPTATLHVDGAARVGSFTVASAPSASASGPGAIIYVSDEAGGACLAFSDGTDWRRSTDRAVIA